MTKVIEIELAPSWRAVLPILLAGMEHGDDTARDVARAELKRMADAADKWNQHVKETKS